jgi:hypothetical protein
MQRSKNIRKGSIKPWIPISKLLSEAFALFIGSWSSQLCFLKLTGLLDQSAHRGFDAVLGNPPYISTHTSSEESWRSVLERGAGYLEDLYVHFTDLGFQLLRPGGTFGFIVSDTFFTLASKMRMRRFLHENTLLYLGQCDPFEATVDAAIFVARKGGPSEDHELVLCRPVQERAIGESKANLMKTSRDFR